MALISFQKIEKSITESYDALSDPEDKRIFFEYLLTNLKLWFERFNDELQADVQPPQINTPVSLEQPQEERPRGLTSGI